MRVRGKCYSPDSCPDLNLYFELILRDQKFLSIPSWPKLLQNHSLGQWFCNNLCSYYPKIPQGDLLSNVAVTAVSLFVILTRFIAPKPLLVKTCFVMMLAALVILLVRMVRWRYRSGSVVPKCTLLLLRDAFLLWGPSSGMLPSRALG